MPAVAIRTEWRTASGTGKVTGQWTVAAKRHGGRIGKGSMVSSRKKRKGGGKPAGAKAGKTKVGTAKRKRRLVGALSGLLTVAVLAETVVRLLPADLQALPYVPLVLFFVPWLICIAALALGLAVFSRRMLVALLALVCLAANCWWQHPFFAPSRPLAMAAASAVAHSTADTDDQYARVMTLNVYKGEADAQAIVDLVRNERVEVLALQETTSGFIERLKNAHIETYLPYSQVSTMDGAYGNGLWSATPLADPVDDAVNSSASFMPGGTVAFSGGQRRVRFVSVHTTSPWQGDWRQWKRSLDELGLKRADEGTRYVFMGDFNATMDHASMREFLGTRFHDAAYGSGHGFAFTAPANLFAVPSLTAVDHVVVDSDIMAGQVQVKRISGSDHAALLATIDVGR